MARDARALQKAAHAPRPARRRREGEAEKALAQAEALKHQARLEDLTVWEKGVGQEDPKGFRTYT